MPGSSPGRGGSRRVTALEVRANRLDVLDRLVADLAHEVKNPLNAVVINLELLKRRVGAGATEDALEYTDRVGREVHRVHAIMDALFSFMRPHREPEPPVRLGPVLGELLPLMQVQAKAARVAYDHRPADEQTLVSIHPHVLKQVVLTLFAGVLDATATDGAGVALETVEAPDAVEMRLTAGERDEPPDAGRRLETVRSLLGPAGGRLAVEAAGSGGGACIRVTLPAVAGG